MPRESGGISRPSSSPRLFQRLERRLGHEPPTPRSPTLRALPQAVLMWRGTASQTEGGVEVSTGGYRSGVALRQRLQVG